MDFVIDVQGFRDAADQFIPKEVAVLAVDAPYTGHWIVAPPVHPFDNLPKKIRQKNEWLTHNQHGLEWFEGGVSMLQLAASLRELAWISRRFFVRGWEKSLFVQNFTTRHVVNLKNIDACPAIHDLPMESDHCIHHVAKRRLHFYCALNSAARLKRWLLENPRILNNPEDYEKVGGAICSGGEVEEGTVERSASQPYPPLLPSSAALGERCSSGLRSKEQTNLLQTWYEQFGGAICAPTSTATRLDPEGVVTTEHDSC